LIAKIYDPCFNYHHSDPFPRLSPIPWSAPNEKAAADRRANLPHDDYHFTAWEKDFFDGSLWEENYYREYEASFGKELDGYKHLAHLQGFIIPHIYASGRVLSGHGNNRSISPCVILMEHIPSETLSTFPDPQSIPNSAYHDLVMAVRSLASYSVIHDDMRPDNILVSDSLPRCLVLIDFGLCICRFDEWSDEEWRKLVICEGDELQLELYMKKLGVWHEEWKRP
ncbi:hypothetical protein DFH29DRAFT_1018861, partial [Suillus ampliporus]